jgi:hypothetical protein
MYTHYQKSVIVGKSEQESVWQLFSENYILLFSSDKNETTTWVFTIF